MLELAIKLADRSTGKRHKTGAVITTKSGDILSTGWSHRTNTTLQMTPWSMHAEHHAISRLNKSQIKRLKGATIYVATVCANSKNLTSAKPCKHCAALLSRLGITQVIYTERIVW